MDAREQIDVAFDVRSDTPTGKDPDTHSRTLVSGYAPVSGAGRLYYETSGSGSSGRVYPWQRG